jgi:hypothetical protein
MFFYNYDRAVEDKLLMDAILGIRSEESGKTTDEVSFTLPLWKEV